MSFPPEGVIDTVQIDRGTMSRKIAFAIVVFGFLCYLLGVYASVFPWQLRVAVWWLMAALVTTWVNRQFVLLVPIKVPPSPP